MDRENESLLRYGCPLLCGESQSQGMEKIFSVSRRDYFKMGFVKLTNYVSHADLVILGGWNNLYYFAILVYGLFTKRKIALFSDYPKPQKKNLKYFIKG